MRVAEFARIRAFVAQTSQSAKATAGRLLRGRVFDPLALRRTANAPHPEVSRLPLPAVPELKSFRSIRHEEAQGNERLA